MLTSGAYRGFAAIRDQWPATWIEEKPESKWENPKTTLETKSGAHKTSIYDETEKHMLKNGKSTIRNEHTI